MALRKLLLILSLFIMADCFGQSPMFKLIAKKSGGCSYLLDQYSGAAAAYSLRKLDCDYAGSAIRVRRSSDNTEQDIGFVNGNLDTATLKTFVGTGGTDDGFVVTWYDQVGSANATQSTSTAQPQIMDNGAILRDNGKPVITFDGAVDQFSISVSLTQPFNVFVAARIPTASSSSTWYYMFDSRDPGTSSDGPAITYNSGITEKTIIFAGTILGDNTARSGLTITSGLFNSTSSNLYHNNSLLLSGNAGTRGADIIYFGRNRLGSLTYNVKMFEFICWPSDQSSNRSGINSNINTYYSIY